MRTLVTRSSSASPFLTVIAKAPSGAFVECPHRGHPSHCLAASASATVSVSVSVSVSASGAGAGAGSDPFVMLGIIELGYLDARSRGGRCSRISAGPAADTTTLEG
jgi:hypothetical protein